MDSIDSCKSLKEITKRRLKRYNDQVADGDNYEGVLVGIYEKPTHFVYELLQNADDALATEVCFELYSDKLVFCHNGSKDFSLKDIISITGVGNSTKKDGKNVGKFGVGFKSVFAITDTPLIYNRAFNFRIEHLSIPYEIDPDDLNEYTTKFVLPFNSSKNKNDKNMIVEKISEELSGLDCATIMFLRNINKIFINDRGEGSEILLNREELENYELVQDLGSEKTYYLFKDNKTNVSFSFLVEEDKICPLSNVYLYSFLPTRIRSELPFYVDAPFDLATTRESIEFDSEKNKEILNQIAMFFKDVLLKLRDEQYVDQDFLNDILPVDCDMCSRSRIYDRLYDKLKDILKDTELLPTTNKKYTNASNGVLPLTKEMAILSSYDKPWLDIDYSHSTIRDYLSNELNVEKINILDFSSYLVKNNILKKKNIDWLLKYYALCANNCNRSSYWYERSEADKLKELPIIKTRTGKFVCAYIDDEAQVFRYSKGIPNSKLIHGLFTSKSLSDEKKEDMRQFLSMLDIRERSPRQYIESTLLAEWDDLANKDKRKTFFEICDIYNTASSSDKSDIISLLRDFELFPAIQHNKKIWATGFNLMRGTKEQKMVFKNAAFLQKDYWTDVIEKDKKNNELQRGSKDLCLALGIIEDAPIITIHDYDYNYRNEAEPEIKKKYGIDTAHYPRWWYSKLNRIDNFDAVIAEIKNSDEVYALIELLSRIPKDSTEDQLAGASQNGRKAYSWRTIPASYIRSLNNVAWVFVNGRRRRTRDLKRDDFVKQFNLTGTECFLDQIDFKKMFVDIASDDERRAIQAFEGLDEDDKKKVERYAKELSEKKNKATEDSKTTKSHTANINISEAFPLLTVETLVEDTSIINDSNVAERNVKSGINKHSEVLEKVEKAKKTLVEKDDKDSEEIKKELGDAAEKCVVEILKKKYKDCEINWFGGNNEGYDIAISKDGEDIRYIEVKAIADYSGRINVTPSEWNYAKDKKDAYDIYVVNANSGRYTIINNPYQQYIDGKINIDVNAIIY